MNKQKGKPFKCLPKPFVKNVKGSWCFTYWSFEYWQRTCKKDTAQFTLYAPTIPLLYTLFIPKKTFTPSHNYFFLLIFSRLKCEGLLFQAFTSVHLPCECFTARVNALKSKPSHSKPLKINRKQDSCEWVNAFWGNNYVYIIARIRAREL